jgi:hypothetical protein
LGVLMGPMLHNSENGVSTRDVTENRPISGDQRANRALSPISVRSFSPLESRLNNRFGRLLSQKKGPDAVMVGVLSIALVLGLHVLWIVAVIVIALGLGFAIANRRRDRIDVVNQRAEDQSL